MPYLLKWVNTQTKEQGEVTVRLKREAEDYMENLDFPQKAIDETMEFGVYTSDNYAMTLEYVKAVPPYYIMVSPAGMLKKVCKPTTGRIILKCRNRDIADKILTTAHKVGKTQFRVPTKAMAYTPMNLAIDHWVHKALGFAAVHLSIGDVIRCDQEIRPSKAA